MLAWQWCGAWVRWRSRGSKVGPTRSGLFQPLGWISGHIHIRPVSWAWRSLGGNREGGPQASSLDFGPTFGTGNPLKKKKLNAASDVSASACPWSIYRPPAGHLPPLVVLLLAVGATPTEPSNATAIESNAGHQPVATLGTSPASGQRQRQCR
jgi:hypothetical protein